MSFHFIESAMHGKVLNLLNLILWPRVPYKNNELFSLQMIDHSRFWIRSALNPNMVLDVEGGNRQPGSRVILYPCKQPPSDNQLFRWQGDMLESCLGGLFLDVQGGSTNDGAQLIVWQPTGNSNQRWRIAY